MELRHIRYALEVANQRNFTRAAAKLNVTQPAITRTVMQLEHELGGKLFHRNTRSIRLTELGHIMMPYFARVAEQVHSTKERARHYFGIREGSLAVGIMCTIGPQRFLPLFRAFRARNPRLAVRFREGAGAELRDAVGAGEIDAAIMGLPEPLDAAFVSLPLYDERFVIAFGPDHPFRRKRKVSVRDLHKQQYLYRENCEFAEHLDAVFAEQRVVPEYPYGSNRDDWIQVMVRAGFGFSFIPEASLSEAGLFALPLCDPAITRKINLVTLGGRKQSPAVGAFVAEVLRWRSRRPPGP